MGFWKSLDRTPCTAWYRFVRYDPEAKPRVEAEADKVNVIVRDPVLDEDITIPADVLAWLRPSTQRRANRQMGQLFKVTVNWRGLLHPSPHEAASRRSTTEGVFLAGFAHYPKPIDEAIAQATAAAQRASILMSQEQLTIPGVISKVDPQECAVCLTCVRLCPDAVPWINEEHKAEILPARARDAASGFAPYAPAMPSSCSTSGTIRFSRR